MNKIKNRRVVIIGVIFFIVCYKSYTQSSTITAHLGFSFQYPAGWNKGGEDGVYEFTKPGVTNVSINIQPNLYASRNDMTLDIKNINDGNRGTYLEATYSEYGSNGLYVKHEGNINNAPLIMHSISLFSTYWVGITISASCVSDANTNAYLDIVKQIAATVKFSKPLPSPYALQWKKRIAGRQLLYLNSESGVAGGSYEKRTYDLCSNGNFIMTYDNGYSSSNPTNDFSAAGSDEGSGKWEVYSLKGQGFLFLRSRSGIFTIKYLADRISSNEINIDGTKYFIMNVENCR